MPLPTNKNDEMTIMKNRFDSITLSTGNVNKKYILRDIIFATDRVETDLFSEKTNPNDVFKNVCLQLKQMAFDYEADAVINCHFEEKFIEKDGKNYVEIFAYGTVVQFMQTNIG